MDEIQEESSSSSNNNNNEERAMELLENQNQDETLVAGSSRSASLDQPRSEASSRTRRLLSSRQSTFHEHELDNVEFNSQRQFLDEPLSTSDSSNESEEGDLDEMFEEYLRERAENARTQATPFDNELPMCHSYLGENMDQVRGTTVFEPGKIYEIPVCGHHSMVFPGEILPMIMIAESIFGSANCESEGGLIFGICFPDEFNNETYGVTCQVFERGIDNNGHITVKSKAHQRFVLVKPKDGDIITRRNQNTYAKVKVLPEYLLPDPITLTMTNNSLKFMHTPHYQQKLKHLAAMSTSIPRWIFDQYSMVTANEKVERFLAMLNIKAPEDPGLKSFWLARNTPLNSTERMKIFATNCVNKRMMMIGDSLNYMCCFKCKRCRNSIAIYDEIFAMAKGNVNANYCNPAGYIHETLTVQKILENSLQMVDRPSTEFSWFPGYAWQIAVCSNCQSHIGWKFIAVVKNLKPKTFFGLSNKSLIVDEKDKGRQANEENESNESNVMEHGDDENL